MNPAFHILPIAAALVFVTFSSSAPQPGGAPPEEFDTATMIVERNVTDGDAEIVIEVNSGDFALKSLKLLRPNGKLAADLSAKKSMLGIRELAIETPEPAEAVVLAAFPPGTYKLVGRSVDGDKLVSEVVLSHDLPTAPAITNPTAGATGVSTQSLLVSWNAVPGAARYFVELECEVGEEEFALTADVPAGQTTFSVPAGWMLPGTEHQLGVGTHAANGNLSITEILFTTAP